MRCIGDECHVAARAESGGFQSPELCHRATVMVGVFGLLCAGLGYQISTEQNPPDPAGHLAVLAPPLVLVSALSKPDSPIRNR